MGLRRREFMAGLGSSLAFLSSSSMTEFSSLRVRFFYEKDLYNALGEERIGGIKHAVERCLETLNPINEATIINSKIPSIFESTQYYSKPRLWSALAYSETIGNNVNDYVEGEGVEETEIIKKLSPHSNILLTADKTPRRGSALVNKAYCPNFWCRFGVVGHGLKMLRVNDFSKIYYERSSPGSVLVTLAHEVGHNIGLDHMDGDYSIDKSSNRFYSTIMSTGYIEKLNPRLSEDYAKEEGASEYVMMKFNSDITAKDLIL